jgi:hypothetical protein
MLLPSEHDVRTITRVASQLEVSDKESKLERKKNKNTLQVFFSSFMKACVCGNTVELCNNTWLLVRVEGDIYIYCSHQE